MEKKEQYDNHMIYEGVVKVLTEKLGLSQEHLTDKTDLINHLGLDSIRILEMVVYLEEFFDIEISDDDLTLGNFQTIKDIQQTLERTVAAGV